MTTKKITDKQLEESIKAMANAILDSRKGEIEGKFKDKEIEIDINKPEEFFFKYMYDESVAYDQYLQDLVEAKTNPMYAAIFINYEPLLYFLSDVFRKEQNGSCGSTDKAHTVLRYCLRRSLGKKGPLQGDSYNSPIYKSGETWYKLIWNHPFIRTSRYREFAELMQEILRGLDRAKNLERNFATDCCDYIFMNPTNRSLTAKNFSNGEFNLFDQYVKCKDLTNVYLYLKRDHPHLVKVYKKFKVRPPGKQERLISAIKTLESFKFYENGWFDKNDGTKFSQSDINKVVKLVTHLSMSYHIVTPHIYPSPDNEINLDWDIGDWNISCDAVFNHGGLNLHALNLVTGEVETLSLDLIEDKAEEVANFIIKTVNRPNNGKGIKNDHKSKR